MAIKISGACTLSHEPFPYADIWEPLGRIFEAFGFDRCMWGTDWTRAVRLLTYEQGVEAFRATDRALGRGAVRAHGRDPHEHLQVVARNGDLLVEGLSVRHCYENSHPTPHRHTGESRYPVPGLRGQQTTPGCWRGAIFIPLCGLRKAMVITTGGGNPGCCAGVMGCYWKAGTLDSSLPEACPEPAEGLRSE